MLLVVTLLAVIVMVGQGDNAEFGFSDRVQIVDLEGEIVDSRDVIQQLKGKPTHKIAQHYKIRPSKSVLESPRVKTQHLASGIFCNH